MGAGGWFDQARRLVVFCLGVAVIIEGLFSPHDTTAELVIGSIMVGILPLDSLLGALGRLPRPAPPPPPSKEPPP